MSRSYYAAFCSAKMKVKERDPRRGRDDERGSHDEIWGWFRDQPSQAMKKIGVNGFRLKNARVSADYKLESRIDDEQAKLVLEDTRKILQTLRSI